jgi:hypothetical protein
MQRYALLGLTLFAALPATGNYKLNDYSFGSSGGVSSSATYSIEGSSGDVSGGPARTATYTVNPGAIQAQAANVPKISALDNGSGQYYNKLHFVLDTQGNPTDTKYLITVSTAGFSGDNSTNHTQENGPLYLHADGTLSATLSAATDYQTYAALGSGAGSLIIGLVPSTTYYVRAKAVQGKFSESLYGPSSSTATAAPSLTFSLVTSTQSSPPYSVDFGSLTAGTIATSTNTIDTTLSTNGASGGDVYIRGQNGSLLSSSTGNHIDSSSTDLGSGGVTRGFGAQNSFISQGAGGPYSVASIFNVSSNNVGVISTAAQSLYTSTAPVTNGLGKLLLKAKSSSTDVAATDYREVLTFIAAGNF